MMLKYHDRCPSLNPPRKLQNEIFWHRHQIWLDYKQQSENSILALTCLKSDWEPNTIVIEDSFLFPTVIYMPWFDKWFRSYAILKLAGRLEFLCWVDLAIWEFYPFESSPSTISEKLLLTFESNTKLVANFCQFLFITHTLRSDK
jgi:hypothetical protein